MARYGSAAAPLFLAANFLFLGSAYATQLVIARRFGPSPYAAWVLALAIVSGLNLVFTGGLSQAIVALSADRSQPPRALLAVALPRVGLAAALAAVLGVLGAWLLFGGVEAKLVALAFATMPAYALMAVTTGILQGNNKFVQSALVVATHAAGRLLLVAIAALWLRSITAAMAGFSVASIVAFGVSLVLVFLRGNAAQNWNAVATYQSLWSKVLSFAGPATLLAILAFATLNFEAPLARLLRVGSSSELGSYLAIATIAKFPASLFAGVLTFSFPRLVARSPDRALEEALLFWGNQAGILASLTVLFFGQSLATFLFGSQFSFPLSNVAVAALLAWLAIMASTFSILVTARLGPKAAARACALSLLPGLFLASLAGNIAGVVGLGVGMSVTLLATLLLLAKNFQNTGFSLPSWELLGWAVPGLVFLTFVAVLFMVRNGSVLSGAIGAAGAGTVIVVFFSHHVRIILGQAR